jgi:hypothetical protein
MHRLQKDASAAAAPGTFTATIQGTHWQHLPVAAPDASAARCRRSPNTRHASRWQTGAHIPGDVRVRHGPVQVPRRYSARWWATEACSPACVIAAMHNSTRRTVRQRSYMSRSQVQCRGSDPGVRLRRGALSSISVATRSDGASLIGKHWRGSPRTQTWQRKTLAGCNVRRPRPQARQSGRSPTMQRSSSGVRSISGPAFKARGEPGEVVVGCLGDQASQGWPLELDNKAGYSQVVLPTSKRL